MMIPEQVFELLLGFWSRTNQGALDHGLGDIFNFGR